MEYNRGASEWLHRPWRASNVRPESVDREIVMPCRLTGPCGFDTRMPPPTDKIDAWQAEYGTAHCGGPKDSPPSAETACSSVFPGHGPPADFSEKGVRLAQKMQDVGPCIPVARQR